MEARESLFRETEPKIFTTNPRNPQAGHTFVWAWTEWFEREEGDSGAVTFTPIADSESELRKWLSLHHHESELTEIKGLFARDVMDDFLEQVPLFPEAPETSSEEPFQEQNPDEDVEHY